MINLAGNKDCDREIRRELTRCRVPIVEGERSPGEVPATLTGKLGPFSMWRAWTYWVAKGAVPLTVAWELYDDPVGKTDVRVDGHCACPPPEGHRVRRYDSAGKQIVLDKTGDEQGRFLHYVETGAIPASHFEQLHWVSFESDLVRQTECAVVESYHIDTEIGLRLFADTIRKHGLHAVKEPTP